tara:strand:- start:288 stop:1235 length:948 start_codon:yes stop_codon:yes gene_type:complete
MSSGGSAGDAGSTSQEAANFEDYNTSTDLVDSSVSIDEFGTSPSNNTSTTSSTSNTGFEESPEMGGNRTSTTTTTTTTDSDGDDIDSQYVTGKEFNVTPVNQPSVIDYAKDEFRKQNLFKKGTTVKGLLNFNTLEPVTTTIGLLYEGAKAKREAEKKTEPTLATGEDGIGEGDYQSTVADWAESRGLTNDYSSEDLETQRSIDQQAFDAGFRTQEAKDMNLTGGDNNNPPTVTTGDNDYAVAPSPFKIVNTQGTGLPDPSNFIYNYVGSKQNILDLYDNVQNVLYKPQTNNGLLAVSDSPYYDFLKTRNLDRRIL